MNNYITILLISFCFTISACGQTKKKNTKTYPQPIGYINDFENILTVKEEKILDSLVTHFEQQTQIEIAIVTIDSSMTSEANFANYTFSFSKLLGSRKKRFRQWNPNWCFCNSKNNKNS